jgi:hypothetical protein
VSRRRPASIGGGRWGRAATTPVQRIVQRDRGSVSAAEVTSVALSDRIDPAILGHILAQHRELHGQIVAARAAFSSGPVAVRAALATLRDHLAVHFVQEERGGFLEESIARMPRLSTAADGVLEEHPRLLAELDRLIERLAVRDISPVSWSRACHDFEDFCGHLLAHERNEHAVVQEGYNEDLGLD